MKSDIVLLSTDLKLCQSYLYILYFGQLNLFFTK